MSFFGFEGQMMEVDDVFENGHNEENRWPT
jgi:hypothetical protein